MSVDYEKLVRKFEEDPVPFMAAASGVLFAIGKVIGAVGQARGSNAYARDVSRRVRASKRAAKKS